MNEPNEWHNYDQNENQFREREPTMAKLNIGPSNEHTFEGEPIVGTFARVQTINGKTRFRICFNFSKFDQSSQLMALRGSNETNKEKMFATVVEF